MAFSLKLISNSDLQLVDRHFRVKCPHCAAVSGLSAISVPQYKLLQRYRPKSVGIAYQCDACQEAVFLRFDVQYDFGNGYLSLNDEFEEVERPVEDYEYSYLPEDVASDFREALTCYSYSCFNAFAAMCRRTIQSASEKLGAEGKDKVLHQIRDLKAMAEIDDDAFDVLKAIVIAGHDGTHPYLPSLSPERAAILLELMKDVLYQLFVRKKKIEEAAARRQQALQEKKTEPPDKS